MIGQVDVSAALLRPGGTPPAPLRAWVVGQILTATVLATTGADAVLEIGGQRISARTAAPLPPAGTALTLQVLRAGAQPVLVRLPAPAPTTGATAEAGALRDALPRQDSPARLLANLGRLFAGARDAGPDLPAGVARTATAVLANLPTADEISVPAGLKRAVENSGLFLEARLRRAGADARPDPALFARDFKAGLLRLLAAAPDARPDEQRPGRTAAAEPAPVPPTRQQPPQAQPRALPTLAMDLPASEVVRGLLDQADAALARVEVAQLQSLPDPNHTATTWLLELPVRQGEQADVLQLRVDGEDGAGPEGAARTWTVTLAMDLGTAGPFYARVTLAGDALSASLWAEDPATTRLVTQHIDWLASRLRAAGLDDDRLAVRQGRPDLSRRDPLTAPALVSTRV
ncbi:MAG: flagellar hook-length control protein FliK [Gammaproteobacteria bacterium]|nr:flagellar hook-length control protein FliK [Gammaproteobacteria bacterium]